MKKLDKPVINYMIISTYTLMLFFILYNIGYILNLVSNFFGIISPFIIGFLIAFILNILVRKLEYSLFSFIDTTKIKDKAGLKRGLSILLAILIVFTVITLLIAFVLPQLFSSVMTLIDSVPGHIKNFEEFITPIIDSTDITSKLWNSFLTVWQDVLAVAGSIATSFLNGLVSTTVSATSVIVKTFIGFVISIYMLLSKETLILQVKKLLYATFKKEKVDKLILVGNLINNTFAKFFTGQLLEALIIGTLCFLGLIILRMPYPLLIATIIGATNMLPVVGPFIGAIPSAFIILMVDPTKSLIFIIFILVLQQLENNLIYPKVVGTSIGLSALWVLLAITIGGSLGGALGMLLGVPSMAVVYNLMSSFINKKLHKKGITLTAIENVAIESNED